MINESNWEEYLETYSNLDYYDVFSKYTNIPRMIEHSEKSIAIFWNCRKDLGVVSLHDLDNKQNMANLFDRLTNVKNDLKEENKN